MRRVAYDARLFGAPPTGIGRWTEGLLPALLAGAPDVTWVALGDVDALSSIDAPNLEVLHTAPRRHLLWQLVSLPGLLRRARADAFLSVWNLVTASGFRGRQIPWLHDLIPFRAAAHGFRSTYAMKTRLQWRLARRRLHRLVVVSEYTGADARATLGASAPSLAVVHPGFDLGHFQRASSEEQQRVRAAYELPSRYVLGVGGAEPRKNLRLAVEAWKRLPERLRGDAVLALGGSDFRGRTVLDGVDGAAAAGVRDLRRLPDADLLPLISGATAFVYPSLAEGFGMPPIEAMACGTPVLVADSTSIPEAVGDGALVAPPEAEAFAGELARLLSDGDLRHAMVARGRARAESLTWAAAAEKVLGLLE